MVLTARENILKNDKITSLLFYSNDWGTFLFVLIRLKSDLISQKRYNQKVY
jgi:hypothetical protein